VATDGAGSWIAPVHESMHLIEAHETDLEHGYKELSMPADAADAIDGLRRAAHLAASNYMLIALPNAERQLHRNYPGQARRGSFESLTETSPSIDSFRRVSRACELMPDRIEEFKNHPVGFLGTVGQPLHHRVAAALIGTRRTHRAVSLPQENMLLKIAWNSTLHGKHASMAAHPDDARLADTVPRNPTG